MADITGRRKYLARKRRHRRVRKHIEGTSQRPRMNIFRSNKNIFVQVIDDIEGVTLVSCSTIDSDVAAKVVDKTKTEAPTGWSAFPTAFGATEDKKEESN